MPTTARADEGLADDRVDPGADGRPAEAARRWFTGVVVAVALMGILVVPRGDPPASDARLASEQLRTGLLTYLGREALEGVSDLRDLARPTPEIRRVFAMSGAVYRVLEAAPDHATLEVWQDVELGANLVANERRATGTGCVVVRRDGPVTSAEVVDCPGGLPERPDPFSWRESLAFR